MTTRDVLTKGRGLNRRPLPLEPIPAQDWLAQSKFAELDEHNSNSLGEGRVWGRITGLDACAAC